MEARLAGTKRPAPGSVASPPPSGAASGGGSSSGAAPKPGGARGPAFRVLDGGAGGKDGPTIAKMELVPLGGGAEVGRSCHILKYKGKTIMLDCGVLPSYSGEEALPFLREVDPADIDIVIITHFHLDHAAALPHFTERLTGFRGRIYATQPTIAVMKMVLADYIRVTSISSADLPANKEGNELYDEADIDRCLDRITPIDFRQRVTVDGVGLTFFNAGHVLGAAMVMMEIAGVRILYTGDYSCEEDRHLMAAEVPRETRPDVLIVEATHGISKLETRMERETRFTTAVADVVMRGGRCLIPVFALGRAQELLLILDNMWATRPELQHIPIYHASKLACSGLDVYKAYVGHMNAALQASVTGRNPFDFRYIKHIRGQNDFVDSGPCVVLAPPGMLQSGLSRQLFERWCSNPLNGIVLAGYSTEGTLARRLETNLTEEDSLYSDKRLAIRLSVTRISFSAHADYTQTTAFVDALKPPCVILVHGERAEMRRLHLKMRERYDPTVPGFQVFSPENLQPLVVPFRDERSVKGLGRLVDRALKAGTVLHGLLLHKNFQYLSVAPVDLARYTPLVASTLRQRLHVPFTSPFALLNTFVRGMYSSVEEGSVLVDAAGGEEVDAAAASGSSSGSGGAAAGTSLGRLRRTLTVRLEGSGAVTLMHAPPDRVILSWIASPTADMVADSLVALISHAQVTTANLWLHTPSDGPGAACCKGGHSSGGGCGHAHGGAGESEHSNDDAAAAAGEGSSGSGKHWLRMAIEEEAEMEESEEGTGSHTDWRALLSEAAAGDAFVQHALTTDSSLHAASASDTCSAGSGGGEGGSMPGPLARRRDLLVGTLAEQFGGENVLYWGPDAEALVSTFGNSVLPAPVDQAGVSSSSSSPALAFQVIVLNGSSSVGVVSCDASAAADGAAGYGSCFKLALQPLAALAAGGLSGLVLKAPEEGDDDGADGMAAGALLGTLQATLEAVDDVFKTI